MSAPATDRDRILSKIKKCLALGNSSEPHEAAAAMRQAQKLMEAHGISEHEMNGIDVGHETGNFKERAYNKNPPIYAQELVSLIMKAMGVDAVFESRQTGMHFRWCVRYFGPAGRATMAAWAHGVLLRAMNQAYQEYISDRSDWERWMAQRYKGARTKLGFFSGWIDSVRSQVEEFGFPDEEKKAIDSKKLVHYGLDNLPTTQQKNLRASSEALEAGSEAGARFRLSRPVDGASQKLLGRS
jgi:hypothetical protein